MSHHPPALSTYAEGPGWTLYQEFTMTSKFRGQYLSITPMGTYAINSFQLITVKFLIFSRLFAFNIQEHRKSFYMEKSNNTSKQHHCRQTLD